MANTFSTPLSTIAIGIARTNYNDSLHALLTSFHSSGPPTSENITIEGVQTAPPDGMLFSFGTNGRLYRVDSVTQKGNPVLGGNFTRLGIAWAVETSLATANVNSYEVGEGFATVGANTRLYIRSSNTANAFVDIGIPPANTITASMIQPGVISGDKVTANIAIVNRTQTFELRQEILANLQSNINSAGLLIKANTVGQNSMVGFSTLGSTVSAAVEHVAGVEGLRVANTSGSHAAGRLAPLNASHIMENGARLIPPGTVTMYGGSAAPTGWLLCDGTIYAQATYANLYAVIGSTYNIGAEGAGNFRVPDVTTRFPIGVGGSRILGSNSDSGISTSNTVTAAAGGGHDHTNVTLSVVNSAKDSSSTTAISDVQAVSDHTHSIPLPFITFHFIIKY